MDFWRGFYLLSFLNLAHCLPDLSFSVHLNHLSFEDAENYCKPGSYLTNILTENEREKILQTILNKNNKNATFWIGLKKPKAACVQTHLALKGFLWTVDNGSQSNVKIWEAEPMHTCTDARCVLLSVEYGESGIQSSRFVDVTCRQTHPFICRRNITMKCPQPQILGTHDVIIPNDDPYFSQIVCRSGAKFNLTCSHNLAWNVIGKENTDISQLCQTDTCPAGYRKDASGNCVDINECESNPCEHICQNTEGSFNCYEPKSPTSIPDRAEFSEVNKSKTVLSQPTSLPDDVKTNESELEIEEKVGDISNIIVPVIIALLIFIVLLVIVAAIVKACLRRRTIKLARRKAEAVALNGSSSMEKVNEKEET